MTAPPPYPRTPYLHDDPEPFLGVPLHVEEKLDGANVAVWMDDGRVTVMSRGGTDAMDRAGQLGRLRAWASDHDEAVRSVCAGGTAVYGEWLWLTHGVVYNQLPDWLVVLDLWTAGAGFAPWPERDERTATAGLVTPPHVADDVVLAVPEDSGPLLGPARWGSGLAEGVVLRRPDGRRCKIVRPGFTQRSDEDWNGARVHNRLA